MTMRSPSRWCALGGRGVISVVSNEIPARDDEADAARAARAISRARARCSAKWFPLMEMNFVESNPIPVKAAMAMMGLCEPVYRLPMCPPLPQTRRGSKRCSSRWDCSRGAGGPGAANAN